MRVFSPSETEKWLQCPYLWQMNRNWDEGEFRGWRANATLGNMVDAYLNSYYKGESIEVCEASLRRRLNDDYVEQKKYSKDSLVKLALRGARKAVTEGVQVPPEEVIAVQEVYGGARLDLLTRVPGVGLVVTDTKVALEIKDDDKVTARVNEYEASFQLYQQVWGVAQALGEIPKWARVQLIVLNPTTRVRLEPVIQVTEERLDWWLHDARQTWVEMEKHEQQIKENPLNPVRRDFTGCFKYGVCPRFEHCHRGAAPQILYNERINE